MPVKKYLRILILTRSPNPNFGRSKCQNIFCSKFRIRRNWKSLFDGKLFAAGLWIRIDFLRIRIRIRIQHFCSIRIRIRFPAKTELSKTISFSNFFKIKIWVKSNQKYLCNSSKKIFKTYLVLFYTVLL
jgi:hypothetical protein